jgi:hypothetical protein
MLTWTETLTLNVNIGSVSIAIMNGTGCCIEQEQAP